MNQKLLSLALAFSLIGTSFATTEEKKEQIFKAIIKTATQQAEKQFPERDGKDIACAALIGAIGCPLSARAATNGFARPFHEIVTNLPFKSSSSAAAASALGFVGYEKFQQMRTDKKKDQKNRMITELVLAHYAEHPELFPESLPAEIIPFIDHYRATKTILQNETTEALLVCMAMFSVAVTYLSNPVVLAAYDAAEKAYPTRGLPGAALTGAAAGLITTGITTFVSIFETAAKKSAPGVNLAPSKKGTTITTALCGAGVFALYEGWKQRRETQKARMIIEQIVQHYATHQDELSDDQKAFFAPMIMALNEKKSLNIANPHETLSKILFEIL